MLAPLGCFIPPSLLLLPLLLAESKRVPFGPYGNAAVYAVAWLGIGLVLLSVVPTLLWQMVSAEQQRTCICE